jgi:signal transduction histidine kinase
MRERIVGAFVLLTLGILVTFTLVRAYTADAVLTQAEQRKADRSVELLSELVASRDEADQDLDRAYLRDHLARGERVDFVAADGRRLRVDGDGYRPAEASSDVVVSHDVPGGGRITLRSSDYLIDQRVSDVITSLVILGAVLVGLAAALAFVAARTLSRPFIELRDHALALGRGRFDLGIPRYAVPEADTIGQALEQSAGQLHDLVRREREFASNVSHQLRTPITALRLELEDVRLWPDTPPPVADELGRALGQVDRLQTTVNDLLDLARTRRIGGSTDLDLSTLVQTSVERWRAAAGTRDIALGVPGCVQVHLAPGPIEQVLDVLIDNALVHGSGTVTVAVFEDGDAVEVRVSDQGRGRPGDEVFHRNVGSSDDGLGIGLTVAAEIAEALGGRLFLGDGPTTSFRLQLPRR